MSHLICCFRYDAEKDGIYGITWSKDHEVFYKYECNTAGKYTYAVEGIKVDVSKMLSLIFIAICSTIVFCHWILHTLSNAVPVFFIKSTSRKIDKFYGFVVTERNFKCKNGFDKPANDNREWRQSTHEYVADKECM